MLGTGDNALIKKHNRPGFTLGAHSLNREIDVDSGILQIST